VEEIIMPKTKNVSKSPRRPQKAKRSQDASQPVRGRDYESVAKVTLMEGKVADEKPASVLQDGCYLIRYMPIDPSPDILFYEGTLRVLHVDGEGRPKADGEGRAGGDLYCRLRDFPYGRDPKNYLDPAIYSPLSKRPDPATVPDPDKGIPVFPRRDYRYYLEVITILEGVPSPEHFTARFKVHAFEQDTSWPNPGARTLSVAKAKPPAGQTYPIPDGSTGPIYFAGNVIDEGSGQKVGTVTLGWVSPFLRSATVVIDKIQGVEAPGSQKRWVDSFEEAGWSVEYKKRDWEVTGLISDVWTIGELHHALMLVKGERQNSKKLDLSEPMIPERTDPDGQDLLDREWHYHLLCVPLIDGFDRGVMFDTYGSDSDNVPREGAAVAAKWDFEEFKEISGIKTKDRDFDLEKRWGSARTENKVLQGVPDAYFRVAVHEIGHAMGLAHNYNDKGFMATTDFIADEGLAGSNEAKKKSEAAAEKVELFTGITLAALAAQAASGEFAPIAKAVAKANKAAAQTKYYDQSAKEASAKPHTLSNVVNSTEAEAQDRVNTASAKADVALQTVKDEEKKAQELLFPDNLKTVLHFHIDDVNRLRFGPDVTVRPGTAFEDYGPNFADEQITRADGIDFQVSPLLEAVPLGAPVRVLLKVRNTSGEKLEVPRNLTLKAGLVSGRVFDPDGNERTFWPLIKSVEDDEHVTLAPNQTLSETVTLLRGAQKSLFPMEGPHRVLVRATWHRDGATLFVQGETTVRVTPAVDDIHRAAAFEIISTPDTLLSLAISGEHLTQGNEAIQAAIDNPILKPHFAIVQAKRLLTPDPKKSDPDTTKKRIWQACELIDANAVLSLSEIERIQNLLEKEEEAAKAVAEIVKPMIDILAKKIDRLLLTGAGDAARGNNLKKRLIDFQNDLP
jgi:hypothetical protein